MYPWIIALLVIIIIALMAWILFSGSGVFKQRKLQQEANSLREEVRRLREMNDALRKSLGIGAEGRLRSQTELFEFVRDLEGLRCAIAGSKACQNMLNRKYNMPPGPELLDRILTRPGMEYVVKERLADEILVGEVGRTIMQSLDKGATVEKAAAEAGMPLSVAKGQITRLQTLGYVDARLKLTGRGQRALI